MEPTPTPSLLRWHHLSAIACLTQGSTVPSGAAPSAATHLHHRLLGLGLPAFVAACTPDQNLDTEGGLLWHIQRLAQPDGHDPTASPGWPTFNWQIAKESYPVSLRTGLPSPLYLSPAALYVRWPFPGTAGAQVAARLAAANVTVPQFGASVAASADLADVDAFMKAVDDAVDADSPCRPAFEAAIEKGQAKACLLEWSGLGTGPAGLTVETNPSTEVEDTHWSSDGTALHLSLGMNAAAPMINAWPCGAFRGYDYAGPYTKCAGSQLQDTRPR